MSATTLFLNKVTFWVLGLQCMILRGQGRYSSIHFPSLGLGFRFSKMRVLDDSSGSQSGVPRATASASPKNLLACRFPGPTPNPLNLKLWRWGSVVCASWSPPQWFCCPLKFETHWMTRSLGSEFRNVNIKSTCQRAQCCAHGLPKVTSASFQNSNGKLVFVLDK